jgi:S1-C subfamily serine protease
MAMQDYGDYGQPPYGSTMPMPPMPPRPPRRRASAFTHMLVALVAGALGAGLVVALYHPASSNSSASPQPTNSAAAPQPTAPVPQPSGGAGGTGSTANEQAILNKVAPGLVVINTVLRYNSEQAAGTGMVIKSDGLVLTNNHVIEGSTSITATTANGKQYQAKVVGYDLTGDVALIQLQNASNLKTVPLGESSSVKTGDQVVAMGNAQGQSEIVPAAGQVTGLNKTVTASDQGGTVTSETLHGMIETNAAIVSGDSGGPLANASGQVIGIDTAGSNSGFAVQQGNSNGYAIPIDTALSVANQIKAGQASSVITIGYPPFMGVFIGQGSDSNPQDQAQQSGGNGFGGFGGGYGSGGGNSSQGCYNSDANLVTPQNIANVSSGTLVLGTICGGPAAAAGMTAGSVITAVNGQSVGSPDSLTQVVSSKYRPGDTVSVTWVSPSGQRSTSSIKLINGQPL